MTKKWKALVVTAALCLLSSSVYCRKTGLPKNDLAETTAESACAVEASTEEAMPELSEAAEAAAVIEVEEQEIPPITEPEETQEPTDAESTDTTADEADESPPPKKETAPIPKYEGYYGQLYIPAVGINVGLYSDQLTGTSLQTIVDRRNSAAMYCGTPYSSCLVADHSNQDFSRLSSVAEGTTAYIALTDGSRINLQCVAMLNGHNIETGVPYDIVDENYNPVYGNYNMITYTCMSDYYNIRICGWMVI